MVLIVDEFQVISNRRLIDSFASLVRSASIEVPVVVGSRSAPDLGLHRLRLSGELAELGADDLRFRVDEARELLEAMFGPTAADTDAAALTDHTEGWAAGLRLAASAAAMGLDGKSTRDGSDAPDPAATYFSREVLDTLSPDEVRFLLDTSVLDRLSGSLGEALTGRTDGHLILEALADGNLFIIRVDEQGRWFRHHRLFGEFLRRRLRLEDPSRGRRAGLAAAAWHRRQGDEATALRYLVEAAACRGAPVLASFGSRSRSPGRRASASGPADARGGDPPAADPGHLYRLARVLLDAGRLAEGVRWLRRLDEAAAARRAGPAWKGRIEGLWAVHASLRGDALGVLHHCAAARRAGKPRGPGEPASCDPLDPSLPGQLATLAARAHLWLDAPDRASAILAGHFPAGDDQSDDPARLGVLALLACRSGQLQDAWALASRSLELAGEQRVSPMPAILDAVVARTMVLWERHDLQAAGGPAVPASDSTLDLHSFWPLECELIKVLISLGRPGEAMSRLGHLRAALTGPGYQGPLQTRLDGLQLRCQILGDPNGALPACIDSTPAHYPTEVLAWADLCAGRPDRAVVRLNSPGDHPTSVGVELQRLALLARARIQLGDEREGLAALRRALDLGQTGGYVTPFVEDAPELVVVLRRIAGPYPDAYLARVLDRAEQLHGRAGVARPDQAVEPLSGREQEILTYLPSHRSQGQIAAEMYVSINTVKTHIRAVYRKLGVSSRSEAVSVARARQLI
jgi:LuxR family maltose regulon positive regulatory protein